MRLQSVLLFSAFLATFMALRELHIMMKGDGIQVVPVPQTTLDTSPAQLSNDMPAVAPVISRKREKALPWQGAFNREITATSVESSACREQRREIERKNIVERAPELPVGIVERLLEIGDNLALQNRRLRTDFMLGNMAEEVYLDTRRAALRDAVSRFRQALTAAQFAKVYQWNPDSDPFDPEGRLPIGPNTQ